MNDLEQKMLQGQCGSTRAPKPPALSSSDIYEQSDALSLDCLGGQCEYMDSNFKMLWAS